MNGAYHGGNNQPGTGASGPSFGSSDKSLIISLTNVPIQGWSSTFNPVLSMPLVEIGGNKESGLWYGASANNANGSSGYTYRPFYSNVSYNTVSNLGTVTNNDVSAWNFQANQKVKATINWTWSQTSSGSYSASIIKKNTLGSNVNDGNSDWTGYKIAKANSHAAQTPVEISATVLMEAGDYLFPVTNVTDSDTGTDRSMISLTVEKDFSNTNMAHIIKPAVMFLTGEFSSGTNGGGAGAAGSWHNRTVNTIRGESWFLNSLTSEHTFQLQPGHYTIFAQAHFMNTNITTIKLYDDTNDVDVIIGMASYVSASAGTGPFPSLNGSFTITQNTDFQLKYRVGNTNATNDLGQNNSFGVPEVYVNIRIEKLK